MTRFDSLSWGWILFANWNRHFRSSDFINCDVANTWSISQNYDFVRRHKRMSNKNRQHELEFYALLGCLLKYCIYVYGQKHSKEIFMARRRWIFKMIFEQRFSAMISSQDGNGFVTHDTINLSRARPECAFDFRLLRDFFFGWTVMKINGQSTRFPRPVLLLMNAFTSFDSKSSFNGSLNCDWEVEDQKRKQLLSAFHCYVNLKVFFRCNL